MTEKDLNSIYSLLGFARKGGKSFSGFDTVKAKIPKCSRGLLIMAEDSSPALQKEISFLGNKYNLPLLSLGTKEKLGIAVGKSPRGVLLITDEHIIDGIISYYNK